MGCIIGQKILHLLESLLIQKHWSDLNIDGLSIPLCCNICTQLAYLLRLYIAVTGLSP